MLILMCTVYNRYFKHLLETNNCIFIIFEPEDAASAAGCYTAIGLAQAMIA